MPRKIGLAIARSVVEVTAEPSDNEWLVEYLSPAFRAADTSEGASWNVCVDADARRFSALARDFAVQAKVPVDALTLDGSFVVLERAVQGDTAWVYQPEWDAYCGVSAERRSVELVVRPDAAHARAGLLRIVRELATTELLRAGWLPLHASGFVVGGRGCLALGSRGSGKSTLLLHAALGGASYLTNDRAFVRSDAEGRCPVALPMPTIVSLRLGTLERFQGARARYDACRYTWSRTIRECAPYVARAAPKSRDPNKLPAVSPLQLASILGTELQGSVALEVLFFPRVTPERRGITFLPLEPDAAVEALCSNLLAPSRPLRSSSFFVGTEGVVEVSALRERALVTELVRPLRCYECLLGPDAYETPFEQAFTLHESSLG